MSHPVPVAAKWVAPTLEDKTMPCIELVLRWRNWEVRVKLTFPFY